MKSQRPDLTAHLLNAPLSSPTLTIMCHHGRLCHPVSQTERNVSGNTQSKLSASLQPNALNYAIAFPYPRFQDKAGFQEHMNGGVT